MLPPNNMRNISCGAAEWLLVDSLVADPSDCDRAGVALNSLQLDPGSWRESTASRVVRWCPVEAKCAGGLAETARPVPCVAPPCNASVVSVSNASCALGHIGPLCETCGTNYFSVGADDLCQQCTGNEAAVIIGTLVGFTALVVLCLYVVAQFDGPRWANVKRPRLSWARGVWVRHADSMHIRFRILISLIQVIRSVNFSGGARLPPAFGSLLRVFGLVELDLPALLPFSCIFPFNFHGKLVMLTTTPVCIVYHLFLAANIAAKCQKRRLYDLCSFVGFFLMFTMYNIAMTSSFHFLSCSSPRGLLPLYGESNLRYLNADPSISCDQTMYLTMRNYAIAMIFMIGFGVPTFFGLVLFAERQAFRILRDGVPAARPSGKGNLFVRCLTCYGRAFSNRGNMPYKTPFGRGEGPQTPEAAQEYLRTDAWPAWYLAMPYKPKRFWWEVVECWRKANLAGTPVFLIHGSSEQARVILVFLGLWWLAMALAKPFLRASDALLAHLSHALIFATFAYGKYLEGLVPEPLADGVFSAWLLGILLLAFALERKSGERDVDAQGKGSTTQDGARKEIVNV